MSLATPTTPNASPNRSTSGGHAPEKHAWAMERSSLIAAGLRKGMTVLDLGCGQGDMTRFLAAEVGAEGKVVGVDVDASALHAATDACASSDVPQQWVVASAYDTGLPDGSVDFVWARHLFQHLTDPERALAEIRRVLKPGGRVCLIDTHDALLWLQPEPEGHAAFVERAATQQRLRGGDREVGRKLAALMSNADFQDVRTDVHVFTTGRLPIDLFMHLALEPLRAVFPGDDADFADAHLAACRTTLADGAHGSAGFYATYGAAPEVLED